MMIRSAMLAYGAVAAALSLWPATPAPAAIAAAQDPAPAAAAAAAPGRGVQVTFERLRGADGPAEVQVQTARLLSLAVERGETPSPFLSPGLFRATFRTTVVLPVRDRYRFRVLGRGSVKLLVNGQPALEGALRPGKPLQTQEPVRLKKGDNQLEVVFESGALGDGQFRLAWSSPEFGFEPLPPELLRLPADAGERAAGELRRRGQTEFAARHCARCHEPEAQRIGESAYGELDGQGPDLRNVGARARQDWLAAWLRDPRQFRPDGAMPRFDLSAQDAADLAAFLGGLGQPLAAPPFPPEAAAKGAATFRQLGCIACHHAPDGDPAGAALGQRLDLGHVPQKWHAAALVDYLRDPRRDHGHVRMPDFALSVDEATALAAYLLARTAAALPASQGDAARGKKLAQQHRCAICHPLDVELEERAAPHLRNLKPERGCLGEGEARGKAPDHGLDAAQRAALRAFLPHAEQAPFRRAPFDFAGRQLAAQRCTACHGLDGEPSVWAQVATAAQAATPLPADQDPLAQGVPALTWVGSKLQPGWMERFVLGQEKSPRPWLHARMPRFHRFGAPTVQGLVREHGYGPQDEPAGAADAQLAIHGERLVQLGAGFGCVQCHALGDQPAVQVFERAGINLVTARQRLRHEYYSRWLLDPPRIDPDARMPKYADASGKTAFKEVLGGDAAQQFEAIWQYLGQQLRR